MPRAHTEEELARIRRSLLDKGRERFERQGLTRTTISELAEDVAIGKGSFYKFFESKEALFLEVSHREEERFRQDLLDEVVGRSQRELVTTLLEAPSRRLREHPFLRLLVDPDTIAELVLRLGPEWVEEEQTRDREFFVELATRWKKLGILKDSVEPEEVFAGLSGLFLVELQRHLLGDVALDKTLETLRRALLDQWVEAR